MYIRKQIKCYRDSIIIIGYYWILLAVMYVIGRLDGIQTALKPLKETEKIETHFQNNFSTSLII